MDVRFVGEEVLARAGELAPRYAAATPFPHIAIDDFLSPDAYRALSDTFPAPESDVWHQYRGSGMNRRQQSRTFDGLPFAHRLAINEFNGPTFVRFLEKLTGIYPLIPDPHLSGGGLHQTLPGGHLAVHIDYNRHREWRLDRRLNVLLYLNDEWSDEWGGHLELWDCDVTHCVQRIAPIANRLAVFNVSEDGWHGTPEPLACPAGVTRRAIALYYYSPAATNDAADHSTVYRERPHERFRLTARERLSALKQAVTGSASFGAHRVADVVGGERHVDV